MTQPWAGKSWVNFGDSYSANFSNIWQNDIIAQHGVVLTNQYAASGRIISPIYGGGGAYASPNFIFAEFLSGVGTSGWTLNTAALATALAGVDLITVELGTNDGQHIKAGDLSIGAAGDAATTDTFYGNVAYAIQTLQSAAPLARIIWISPLHLQHITGQLVAGGDADNYYSDATAEAMFTALKAVCGQYGVPVVDEMHESGINMYNASNPDGTGLLLRDHVHPSTQGFNGYWTPALSRALLRY